VSVYVWLRHDGQKWVATGYVRGVALSEATDVDANTAQHSAREIALAQVQPPQEMH
jgi:hypothetical protein